MTPSECLEQISRDSEHFLFLSMGGTPIFPPNKSYFFCELKHHSKFQNPRTTLSGRKVCDPEEEKKNNPKIVDTTFTLQCPRAAHKLRLEQLMKISNDVAVHK